MLISIVIVTFNSLHCIKACLHSLFAQESRDYEVIVIDNGSNDDTVDFLKEQYPQVTLIKNIDNLGVCKARNQGIEASRGEWILMLDCDVVLENDFLSKVREKLQGLSSEIGIIQPKILRTDKETIYSCGVYVSWARKFYDIGKNIKDNGAFSVPRQIFGACSAAAAYKRSMLEDLKDEWGYFDDRFFFLVEDVDLAWRARRKKWEACFSPDIICYHSGESAGHDKKVRQYFCFRNRFYSIVKNEGLSSYLKKFFPLIFYDLPRAFYLLLTNRHILTGVR